MAVLHHAFRYSATSETGRAIEDLLAQWKRGDREAVSSNALAAYAAIGQRDDLHAAFFLGPEGPASSWLQPQHISLELAALVLLAPHFISIPNLSSHHDSNHYLLETYLPALGWSPEDTRTLVRGGAIKAMLAEYGVYNVSDDTGGFWNVSGWTAGHVAARLRGLIEQAIAARDARIDPVAAPAWKLLCDRQALEDVNAMLASVCETDWLVMAVTH